MTKSKIRRCEAPGCRTLTASAYCEAHRAPVAVAPVASPKLDDAQWQAMLAEAWRRVKVDREQRAERRELLEGLRAAAGRADRAGEQPVFAHG